mgnify:CR=1 FL=1
MNVLEMIIVVLFATFFLGSCARVITMLDQKKIGQPMMRFRMLFFFSARCPLATDEDRLV